MSHANYLTPSHFSHYPNAYQTAAPAAFTYNQQGYVQHQMPMAQPEQQQQHYHHQPGLAQSLQSYHHAQPMGHTVPRKRTASELDTPPMGSNVGMTPMSPYSVASQGMLGAGPSVTSSGAGLGVGSASGLGISSHVGQGMTSDHSSHMGHSTLDSPTGPPPPKKGRTNTPWTREEEQRLKLMRDAGNSWSEIAKRFPNRTEGSVKKHWYKDMHYTEISEDEGTFKQALITAIKEYDQNKWKIIGQKMGKPAKACEQFAREHLGKV